MPRWQTFAQVCLALALTGGPTWVFAETPSIPAGNDPKLTEAPSRPPLGDLETRATQLLDAIVHDDPARASSMFLPRDAFRVIKAVGQPDPLFDRLLRAYEKDIHTLHQTLPDLAQASFVRVELSRRRGFVRVREEGNRLPYWAQRHNALVYTAKGREHRMELRVLIAWDNRWYLTHLREFH